MTPKEVRTLQAVRRVVRKHRPIVGPRGETFCWKHGEGSEWPCSTYYTALRIYRAVNGEEGRA